MARHRRTGLSPPVLWGLVGAAVLAVVVLVVSLVVRPDAKPSDQIADSRSGGPAATSSPESTTPTQPPPPEITVAVAGDVLFTGRTEGLLAEPGSAFGPISQTLSAADLAVVNLETAITERGVEEPKQFNFRAPASALTALGAAGVDVASMANNHAVDYGPVGLEDTLGAISETGFPIVGVGADAAAAYAPYRAEVDGVGISTFGISQVPDRTYQLWTASDTTPGIASTADTERLIAGVQAASAAGDVVIVYVHWGIEGDACPTPEMADLAGALAAAGADAVVGTHAHLLLGAGYLPGSQTFVAYGLGNFVWWRPQAYSDDTGVLTLTISDGVVTGSEFTPALIDDAGRPQPLTGPAQAEGVAEFAALQGCAGLGPTPGV